MYELKNKSCPTKHWACYSSVTEESHYNMYVSCPSSVKNCHTLYTIFTKGKARECSGSFAIVSYICTCSALGVTFLMNSSISSSCFDISTVLEKDWWSITISVFLFFLPERVFESWLMGVAVQPCMSCKLGLKHTTRRLKPGNRILYVTQNYSWTFNRHTK